MLDTCIVLHLSVTNHLRYWKIQEVCVPGKLLGRSTTSRIDCGNFTRILKLKSRRLISFDIISWMLHYIGICMKSTEIGKQFSAFVCHLFACWLLSLQLEQKKWRLWQWPLSHAMSGRVSHFIMFHPNEEAHPIRFKSTWIEYDKNISKSYQNHKLPKGSNLTLLHSKVISESAFTIKNAFDVKSAFRYHFCYQKRFWYQKWYRKSPIGEWYHHFSINDFVFILTLNILKLYMFFMFVTHTACVSTNKNLP